MTSSTVGDKGLLRSDTLKEEIAYAKVGGLRVFFLPKKGFRRKHAEIFVHYGSNDNAFTPSGGKRVDVPPGIAHFLEHKMFEKPWGDAFTRFGGLGASGNAYTSANYTSYLFSTVDNWSQALELLFEVVFAPHFTEDSVAKEQNIIGQEIRMYNDDPGSRLRRETLEALYMNHPVRLDIAGTEDSIRSIDKDLLYLCHQAFYHTENSSLFVAGDLEADEVFGLAAALVGKFAPNGGAAPARIRPDEVSTVGGDRDVCLPVPIPLLQMAWKDRPLAGGGEDLIRAELATSMMLDIIFGRSSPFFTEAYEEGLIDDLGASCEVWPDYSYSYVVAQTSRPEDLARKVQEQIILSRNQGICEDDFARAKKAMLGRHAMLFDSPGAVGEMQVHLDDAGQDVFSYGRLLEGLTPEDVDQRLGILDDDKSVRVTIRDNSRRG